MSDRGRAQARSRGRAKAKVATPSAASAQAASHQQAQPSQAKAQASTSQAQTSARGSAIRAPVAGPSRRLDAGDATASVTAQMRSMDIKDEPAQMGRGAMRGRREIAPALRTRPAALESKKGSKGVTIRLQSNYFKLLTQTDWCLYQYRVDFQPDEERTGIRKKLLSIHKDKFGGYLFDGSTLWTTCLVRPEPMELFSLRESDEAKVRITIKKTVDLSVGDPAYIQLFNVITRKCLEFLDLQLVGRDYFNPNAKVTIREHRMELWPGFSTSIRQHEDAILMNVEVTHKIMRLETVLDILHEIHNRDNRNWRDIFANTVISTTVMTDYNQKTYRIDDINFDASPEDTFEIKGGEKTTFIEYYQQRYGIRIRERNQPLLISRAKARERRAGMAETIALIPELCRATGLTDEMRANIQLMRALADRTRILPNVRIEKLRDFLRRLQQSQKATEELSLWNMKLSNDLIDFNGRILPSERILHAERIHSEVDEKADWTGALRNKPLLLMPHFKTWVIITPVKLKRDVVNFVGIIIKASSSLQLTIPQPRIEDIPDDRTGTYCVALDRIVCQQNPQLIMTIVPNNRADRYSAIKKKACIDRCVPTQVVLAKNISSQSKGIFSIATKIAIQMNCKLGGAPWSVDIPLSGMMVVGFDTTHDTASRSRSFGATVCTLNKNLTQYYSAVSAHSSGEELHNQISIHITNGCLKYKECNNALPSKIFIYRDGVGEGQLHQVIQYELKAIKEKLNQLYGGQEPNIAVIVVSKRISTRLFDKGGNPKPGTVADDVITTPDRYDFFLVSQSVKQGTVSPTSYNIIYDTTGLEPDRMQRLTYKLTHLYFNWSGTVRVPAPCQYAHKLALLVGQAIHTTPNPQLADRLFFL